MTRLPVPPLLMAAAVTVLSAGSAAASDKIALNLGGYSKWWVVGQWSDHDYQRAAAVDYASVDVKGDNEIHVRGSTVMDNGITLGIKTELEAGGHTDQRTDTIDKAFIWLESGFGKLQLGADYNAASLLHVCAPDAAGLWNGPSNGMMSGTVIARPAAVNTMFSGNQTELDHDDNSEKVVYFSPAFHGLTLGLSHTPNALSEDDRGVTRHSQTHAAGLGYAQTFGKVNVAMSAGALTGNLDAGSAADSADVNAFSLGAQASYAGVTLGGSYGDDRHDHQAGATTDNSGRSWDVGAMVEFGPTQISAAYYQSRARGLIADGGEDTITVYQVSGKYMLGAGVAVMGAVGHMAYDDESGPGNPLNNNKGLSVMTGLGLWF